MPFLSSDVIRNYKKKTDRDGYGSNQLAQALGAVGGGMALLRASKRYHIPGRTLRRHRDRSVLKPGTVKFGHQPVLPSQIEAEIHSHIQFMEKHMYGLSTLDVRRLAFDVAERADIIHPFDRDKGLLGRIGSMASPAATQT